MRRNDYVVYYDEVLRKRIVCLVEQVYEDGRILIQGVDNKMSYLVEKKDILNF